MSVKKKHTNQHIMCTEECTDMNKADLLLFAYIVVLLHVYHVRLLIAMRASNMCCRQT